MLVLILIVGGVVYSLLSRSTTAPASAHSHIGAQPAPSPLPAASAVVPDQPRAMAVGPNGDIYIADPARNEILERHSDGAFTVVAGTGIAGLSGDGGSATKLSST